MSLGHGGPDVLDELDYSIPLSMLNALCRLSLLSLTGQHHYMITRTATIDENATAAGPHWAPAMCRCRLQESCSSQLQRSTWLNLPMRWGDSG